MEYAPIDLSASVGINRYIMECKCFLENCNRMAGYRINRYIMECKCL